MTETILISVLVYPVQGKTYTGERFNASLTDGDIVSDEIGWGETPSDAVSHLMTLISSDVNAIIEEEMTPAKPKPQDTSYGTVGGEGVYGPGHPKHRQ